MKLRPTQIALRISLTYGLVAVVWIVFSDQLLEFLIPDAGKMAVLQSCKGIGFVVATAVLLFVVLRRVFGRWENEVIERRRAEEALSASEAQFRATFEGAAVGIALSDVAGRPMKCNAALCRMLGYSAAELCQMQFADFTHPDDRKRDLELYDSLQKGVRERYEVEKRYLHKSGAIVWGHLSVSVIRGVGGAPSVAIGMVEDITNRKNAETELRRREEHFRRLIENGSDIITVLDGAGYIRFQSPSIERVLGFKPEELTGQLVLGFVHPDDASRVTAALSRALSNPAAPVTEEIRLRHKNGAWRVMQSVGRNVPGEDNSGFIIVNSRDVTESKALEEQFRQAQKMEGVGQLAGGVAHDFNNILAIIQMQVGLLECSEEMTPGLLELVRDINLAAQRAANLTRQLLLFSRRQAIQPKDLDLNEAVLHIAKMLQRVIGEDIHMEFRFASHPVFVRADSGMLDQVLLNLAVNSRDAMAGGGRLIIETSVAEFDELTAAQSVRARPGSFACLSVSDTGAGIAKEVLPRIFEPFFTTKDVGKGTGLGLATVLGIVQQHEGWIEVFSESGAGTTFRIYLPRRAIGGGQTEAVAEAAVMPRGSELLLLVEDDTALRAVINKVLTRLGYHVLQAAAGQQAVDIWNQHRDTIQLVLTDLVMPDGISGKELARQLLQLNPKLKVIYMSGYSPEVTGGDLLMVDGVNFLAKPCEAQKLAVTVRNCLDQD